jgi:TIR domain
MAKVFFSYSHADEALRDQLEKQLSMLKRQGIIETWHDRRIGAGQEFDHEISAHVETDDIILLLVSPDFLASDYCYDREMLRAIERHDAGEAIVIPVILRACEWHGAPFGKLQATPKDGKPITQWPDRDQAMLEVARAVRGAAERLRFSLGSPPIGSSSSAPHLAIADVTVASPIRSSNLRLAKEFTERDKDAFRVETFDYLAKFFENSVTELAGRNPGIEGSFRRIDANRFTAKIYRAGRAVAACTIFMGARNFGGIAYAAQDSADGNGFNENLTVGADEQSLFLKSMGFSFRQGAEDEKLTQEGAAELYWSLFIEPLQRL